MKLSNRTVTILKALFVTFLWSTSWILIKISLDEIAPITFAGIRYSLAVIFLLPGAWQSRDSIYSISKKELSKLIVLGLLFYAVTQGGQFLTLKYLYSTTFSLILNFSSVLVVLIGFFTTRENPSNQQWIGMIVFLIGATLYFRRSIIIPENSIGYILAGITVTANSISVVLGRSINRARTIPPHFITFISMAVGAAVLLIIGFMVEGIPQLSFINIVVIIWLSAVNTAFAFTLWNKTQQVLTALESSLINNSMLIQISILAWIFLGETYSVVSVIGIVIAFAGLIISNLKVKMNSLET